VEKNQNCAPSAIKKPAQMNTRPNTRPNICPMGNKSAQSGHPFGDEFNPGFPELPNIFYIGRGLFTRNMNFGRTMAYGMIYDLSYDLNFGRMVPNDAARREIDAKLTQN
jgi:hypothetical protein